VDHLFSAAQAFTGLSTLELPYMKINCFPASMARVFRSLTVLDLSHNSFTRIPTAVAQITHLERLNMSSNYPLQLGNRDTDILAGLSHLRVLDVSKGMRYIGWSQESILPSRLDCLLSLCMDCCDLWCKLESRQGTDWAGVVQKSSR